MALTADIKINDRTICKLVAERFPDTKPKGVNPYRIRLFDEKGDEKKVSSIVHDYADGPVKLVQRVAQELWNSTNIKGD